MRLYPREITRIFAPPIGVMPPPVPAAPIPDVRTGVGFLVAGSASVTAAGTFVANSYAAIAATASPALVVSAGAYIVPANGVVDVVAGVATVASEATSISVSTGAIAASAGSAVTVGGGVAIVPISSSVSAVAEDATVAAAATFVSRSIGTVDAVAAAAVTTSAGIIPRTAVIAAAAADATVTAVGAFTPTYIGTIAAVAGSATVTAAATFTSLSTGVGTPAASAATVSMIGPTAATLLANDTFSRTTTAGSSLGTMDSGQTWSGGTGGVNANGVQCVMALGTTVTRLLTVGLSVADIDQRFDWEVGALPSTGSYTLSQMARYADSTHHYRLRCTVDTAGVLRVGAAYINGGSETSISTNVIVSGITVAPGTRYCVRSSLIGTAIKVKAWAASTDEPAAWNYSQTDSTLAAAGDCGLRIAVGAATSLALNVDNYTVYTGSGYIQLRPSGLSDQPFYLTDASGNVLTTHAGDRIYGVY